MTEIVADEVEFISTNRNTDSSEGKKKADEVSELEPIDDDSLPF